jgi:Holliday junction resolvasome RuvABC endonuclease subunit
MLIKVIGFDPSLTHWGIAQGIFNCVTDQLEIDTIDLITTEKSHEKSVARRCDDMARAEKLYKGVLPYTVGAGAIFAEVPIGSQTASAMKSYGICTALLGALQAHDCPIYVISPAEVKNALTGNPTASKAAMIKAASEQYPHLAWPTKYRKGIASIISGDAEHMADAIGALVAGINQPAFKQLKALYMRNTHGN